MPEKQYDAISDGTLTFSPDSKRVVYAAHLGDKSLVVIDVKEGETNIQFLGRGRIIFDSTDTVHYLALKDNGIYMIEEHVK